MPKAVRPPLRKSRSGSMEMIRSVLEVVSVDENRGGCCSSAMMAIRSRLSRVHPCATSARFAAATSSLPSMVGHRPFRSSEFQEWCKQRGQDAACATREGKDSNGTKRKSRSSIVADIIAIDDKKGFATLKGSKDNVIDVVVTDRKARRSEDRRSGPPRLHRRCCDFPQAGPFEALIPGLLAHLTRRTSGDRWFRHLPSTALGIGWQGPRWQPRALQHVDEAGLK